MTDEPTQNQSGQNNAAPPPGWLQQLWETTKKKVIQDLQPLAELRPKQIEAIGIALVLIAALWEGVMLRQVTESYNRGPLVELNGKLDSIWNALGHSDLPKFVLDHNYSFYHHVSSIENFDKEKADFWIGPLSTTRIVLFAIGTVLVVVGKWKDGAPR